MKSCLAAVCLCIAAFGCHVSTYPAFLPDRSDSWYSEYYVKMNERPLWPELACRPCPEVYRLMVVASLDERAKLVRVDVEQDGTRRVTFKELSRGSDSIDKTGSLSARQEVMKDGDFAFFTNLLERSDFWNLPSRLPHTPVTLDGVTPIAECIKSGRYHFVTWWHPVGPYGDAWRFLLNLGFVGVLPKDFVMPSTDELCMNVSAQDVLRKWGVWKNKEDVVGTLGYPTRIETEFGKTMWLYYLRDRDVLVISFDKHGVIVRRVCIPAQETTDVGSRITAQQATNRVTDELQPRRHD